MNTYISPRPTDEIPPELKMWSHSSGKVYPLSSCTSCTTTRTVWPVSMRLEDVYLIYEMTCWPESPGNSCGGKRPVWRHSSFYDVIVVMILYYGNVTFVDQWITLIFAILTWIILTKTSIIRSDRVIFTNDRSDSHDTLSTFYNESDYFWSKITHIHTNPCMFRLKKESWLMMNIHINIMYVSCGLFPIVLYNNFSIGTS